MTHRTASASPLLVPLLAQLDAFAEEGQLRRLSAAFARFMASLGMTQPAQIVSCTMLSELEGRGHSCLMLEQLASDPCSLLGWSAEHWQLLADAAAPLPADAAGWRNALAQCEQVWLVGQQDRQQPLILEADRLYLRRYWRDETLVAQAVGDRAASQREVDAARAHHWIGKLFDAAPQDAASPDWQKIACAIAVRSTFSIITGGPGTGKTYTVARLLALLFALAQAPDRLRIALAAPTGKAAARLKQSIDDALGSLAAKVGDSLPLAELTARMGPARTLHSLLGARPDTRAFRHHAGNPLDIDVLIVDEASMVHLEMMASLVGALPANAMLILLGDKDQLASVEAGAVLGDLCRDAQAGAYSAATAAYVAKATGEAIPAEFLGQASFLKQQTVMLRKSRRFSGPIGQLALAVNAGAAHAATECLRAGEKNILAWLTHAQQSDMLQLALGGRTGAAAGYRSYLGLLRQRPDSKEPALHAQWAGAVLQSFESFRVLCAVREGEWGVAGLNQAIEQQLEAEGCIRRRSEWYVGRPVMVTRNDYGTGVFNGDIGIALPDPLRADALRVYFLEGQAVHSVLATRLRDVETAYAMTVHKSQGSEFRHTVMVLPRESSPVVTRELVYTGITRAREHFTLVSPVPAVFEEALARRTRRASGLASRLNASGPD